MSGMEVAEIVNPFEELGIPQTSGPEEVRKAYHLKAKLVHPDQFQDAEQQAEANRKMVRLNQAYEEAMKQVGADASEEEILKAVEEQLGKEAEKQTFNIEIPVFDFIDSRQVQMTSDLSDAITGGLISYMAQQMEGGEGHE